MFWVQAVLLGNYLQQMTSADDIFGCIFFLGALRAKTRKTIITKMLSGNKTQLYGEQWCPFIRRDVVSGNYVMSYVVAEWSKRLSCNPTAWCTVVRIQA